MADADQIDLLYAEESTFATPPAAGTWKNVRLTGESLGQDTEYAQSAELRKDRQVVDQIRLDVSGSGDINYEFSYGAFDDFIEAVLMGTWDFTTASTQRTASIADASIASNVITAGSGTPFADFSIGMWVKLSNAGDPLNNGIIGKISTASDTVLTLTHCTLTDDASDTLDIDEMEFVTNGTTFRTFSFERIYTDIGTFCIIDS